MMLRFLFLLASFCFVHQLSAAKPNPKVMIVFWNLNVDERKLRLNFRSISIFAFPNTTGHFRRKYRYTEVKSVRPGVLYPIQLASNSKITLNRTIEYVDGTRSCAIYQYRKRARCRLIDADKFPRDRLRCLSFNYFFRGSLDCDTYRTHRCVIKPKPRPGEKWIFESMKQKWFNRSRSNLKANGYVIYLRRNPYHIRQRIEFPSIIFGIVTIAQLFMAPTGYVRRLMCSVLIQAGLQLMYLAIIDIPAVGTYGGGYMFGNYTTAIMCLNFIIFLWSIVAYVLLENFASAPLPAEITKALDSFWAMAGTILLLPTAIVKAAEEKSFSRRGDWLKLILFIDRLLFLVGVVILSIVVSQLMP